jgi:hypothetical protein
VELLIHLSLAVVYGSATGAGCPTVGLKAINAGVCHGCVGSGVREVWGGLGRVPIRCRLDSEI